MTITTIDMHTCGEPLRIITGGLPEIPGSTVLERRRYFREHFDNVRTGLLWEPRGHADMYGVVLTPPNDNGADFGAFFLHNEGYSTMCGHAMIALARYSVDNDMAGNKHSIKIDVPAGRIIASVKVENGRYQASSFRNVHSFVYLQDGIVEVGELGRIKFDIAYGGAFYALVEADDLNLSMKSNNSHQFIDLGRRIKRAVKESIMVKHPFEDDLSFLYGVIFNGKAENPEHHSRNVCIFADGELDRSPTGSGVSARAALHYQQGKLKIGEWITIESIIGTTMNVRIVETTFFGAFPAVIPEVSGKAYYTGVHKFVFEKDDPLSGGFLIR